MGPCDVCIRGIDRLVASGIESAHQVRGVDRMGSGVSVRPGTRVALLDCDFCDFGDWGDDKIMILKK